MTAAAGQQRSKATFVQRGRRTRVGRERKGQGTTLVGSGGSHLTAEPHKQATRQASQGKARQCKAVRQLGSHSAWLWVTHTHGAPGWCRVRVSWRWRWCKFSVLGFWFSGCGHKLSQTKSFVPFRAKRARDAAGCAGAARGAARGAKTEAETETGTESWVFSLGSGSRLVSLESQFHFKLKPDNEEG